MRHESTIKEEVFKVIATGIVFGALIISAYGCAGFNVFSKGETLDLWDEAVVTTYISTTPVNARLNLTNMDRGIGQSLSSSISPSVVHYAYTPNHGAYLSVSHPDYESKIVALTPDTKEIHVNLEPLDEEKKKCTALYSFSRAFVMSSNLPDLSSVLTEEAEIPDLINEEFTRELSPPEPELECSEPEEEKTVSWADEETVASVIILRSDR